MDDAARVCCVQRPCDLPGVFERFPPRHHSAADPLTQRLPFEQLHHGVGDAVVAAEVVNGEDIGMRQRRDCMRLALEARQAIGIGRKLHRQDFERNLATQFRVARAIDLSHATGTNRRDDLVDADA